jgi:hypothetical protein
MLTHARAAPSRPLQSPELWADLLRLAEKHAAREQVFALASYQLTVINTAPRRP